MARKNKAPLFGSHISPACVYCAHSQQKEDELLCTKGKRKAIAPDDTCRRFAYDPLKRIPQKSPKLPQVDPKDFSL